MLQDVAFHLDFQMMDQTITGADNLTDTAASPAFACWLLPFTRQLPHWRRYLFLAGGPAADLAIGNADYALQRPSQNKHKLIAGANRLTSLQRRGPVNKPWIGSTPL